MARPAYLLRAAVVLNWPHQATVAAAHFVGSGCGPPQPPIETMCVVARPCACSVSAVLATQSRSGARDRSSVGEPFAAGTSSMKDQMITFTPVCAAVMTLASPAAGHKVPN